MKASDTIAMLKAKIQNHDETILIGRPSLIFKGTKLKDGKSLADYDIQKDSTVDMNVKQ